MASYNEWKAYFDKKSVAYCRKQIALLNSALKRFDSKIKSEFQLDYFPMVESAIKKSIQERT